MRAVLPSQICSFLEHMFRVREPLPPATVQSKVGAVVAFLDLYDRLPIELVRLPNDRYAELVEAVGTIKFGVEQFRNGVHFDCLRPVGGALAIAWRLVELLPDQIPSAAHDLGFISDQTWRAMIGMDISAIQTDLASGEWKSTTILAGACCESLLLYALLRINSKDAAAVGKVVAAHPALNRKPDPSDLTGRSWDLFSYTEVTHCLGLISDNTRSEVQTVRDYRNLIHPAKVVRDKTTCDRGTAYVSVGALEHVVADLRVHL